MEYWPWQSRAENFKTARSPKDNKSLFNTINVGMIDKLKANDVKLIFDVGVDDFLIEPNRDLHQRLLANGTAHDYIERPGKHDWSYWGNALPYQMLFFYKVIHANGIQEMK
jgi:enterochelin esterase-like enzyme